MKIINLFRRGLPIAATTIALAFSIMPGASARSLVFDATPVSDAVAQINHELGIHIALKAGVDPNALVSISVSDLSAPGAQLDAVNQLANALGADYQKTFVISKVIADNAIVPPPVDSNGPVVFHQTTLSAEDAIDLVAAVDNAQVRYYSVIHGDVTMSGNRLSAGDAATEIAEQTHTQWKAYYGLSPRANDRANGTVIGYTSSGQPILELPLISFEQPTPPVAPATADTTATNAAATATNAAADATAQAAAAQTAAQQAAALANGVYPYPNGYGQYGYPYGNPYGYAYGNPYGYSYGYGNPYASAYGYSNPYGAGTYSYGGAGGYTTLGGGGIIMPTSSPYGLGGPVVIGGP